MSKEKGKSSHDNTQDDGHSRFKTESIILRETQGLELINTCSVIIKLELIFTSGEQR